MSNIHKNFNSRTREGATKKQLGGRIGLLVSIHAPVWVRHLEFKLFDASRVFQFTHPCGCDSGAACTKTSSTSFNSRTRVGATGAFLNPGAATPRFNSRTRVGATQLPGGIGAGKGVSIHAPVWVRQPKPRPSYPIY